MSGRRKFLEESAKAFAALMFLEACAQEKLAGPRRCSTISDDAPDPAADNLRDVYIVDGFTGLQLGTKDNPYSVRGAGEFDALMQFLRASDDLAVHYAGRFQTAGVYRWGELASRNLGRRWAVDGTAEISIDPNAIADSQIDGQPLYIFAGPARSVTGVTTIGSHSLLANRFRAKGKSLRTGSVLLEADGSIDGVALRNFGALGAESFVHEIVGRGEILNSHFTEFDPSTSDTQVTVRRVVGPYGRMEGNKTFASGDNWVQAHTIYLATRGIIRGNESHGARVGYYGDYYATKGITIEGNRFLGCEHGVQLNLSPTPVELAGDFSHEGYRIGPNEIESWGANVSLNTCGPSTSTRFIRDLTISPDLSVENFGATNIRRSDGCLLGAA